MRVDFGYAAALSELEGILADLERDTVDVDALAQRVSRAAELMAICRSRIADARIAIESVLVDLDPEL